MPNLLRFQIQVTNRRSTTHGTLVDRSTVFGNPFRITKRATRAHVIARYKDYFLKKVKSDLVFCAAARKLRKADALACWCAPEPCHADVIKEWLENEAPCDFCLKPGGAYMTCIRCDREICVQCVKRTKVNSESSPLSAIFQMCGECLAVMVLSGRGKEDTTHDTCLRLFANPVDQG
jgi:hypothetical protein